MQGASFVLGEEGCPTSGFLTAQICLLRSFSVFQIQSASLQYNPAKLLNDRAGNQNLVSTTTMLSTRDGQSDLAPTEKAVNIAPTSVESAAFENEGIFSEDGLPPRDHGRAAWTSLIAVSAIAMATWGKQCFFFQSSSIVRLLTTSFCRRLWRYSRCFPRVLLQNASFRRKSVGRIHRPSGSCE